MSEFVCLTEAATLTAFGRLVGISTPAAHKLQGKGHIPAQGSLHDWLLAYCEHLRDTAAGRAHEGSADLTEAKIRDLEARALRTEANTARELAQLVPASEAAAALSAWSARGVEALESAERRIVEGIESEFGVALADTHVAAPLRAAAADIGAYAANLSAAARAGQLGDLPEGDA